MIDRVPHRFRVILSGAVLLGGVLGATPAPDESEPVEWIVEDGTTLMLRLVLEERGRPCGGELVVDPNRRLLRFEGMPGETGCERFVEASFTDLEELRVQRGEAGFALEVGGGREEKLVLLPLPHFRWFAAQRRVRQGGLDRQLSALGMVDRDGDAIRTGAPAAPSVERFELPREVVADTEKAVELIREAMGRPPAPADVLWEALYGRPVDTTVEELLEAPGSFASQAIRVRARLLKGARDPQSLYLGSGGPVVELAPEHDAEARFAVAGATWAGERVEVVGRLRRRVFTNDSAKAQGVGEYYISGWQCAGPEARAALEGKAATLEELFARPDDFEGEIVRLQGCFRGRNARGDLPNKSQRSPDHWIIKSDRYAIWVTGHKPAGEGWELNLTAPGNSLWLEVVGRLRWRDGFGYLDADRVRPIATPPGARVRPARAVRLVSSTPDAPASIVFTLPLESEPLGARSRIILQFDRGMEEESFTDRVRLRYAADDPERDEIAARLAYDESRRALIISPVRPLAPGRRVEVLLLPGISDVNGGPLGPRPGQVSKEAVDVVAYNTNGR
jgi:hypothetical protein